MGELYYKNKFNENPDKIKSDFFHKSHLYFYKTKKCIQDFSFCIVLPASLYGEHFWSVTNLDTVTLCHCVRNCVVFKQLSETVHFSSQKSFFYQLKYQH